MARSKKTPDEGSRPDMPLGEAEKRTASVKEADGEQAEPKKAAAVKKTDGEQTEPKKAATVKKADGEQAELKKAATVKKTDGEQAEPKKKTTKRSAKKKADTPENTNEDITLPSEDESLGDGESSDTQASSEAEVSSELTGEADGDAEDIEAIPSFTAEEKADAPKSSGTRKVKKKGKKAESGNLFASVPDADEVSNLTPIDQIDEEELSRIEAEAIAALPHAEAEPELLLYESDEIEDTHESAEEAKQYEEFLESYRQAMKVMREVMNEHKTDADVGELGDISDYIISDDDFIGFEDDEESLEDDEEEYLTAEEIEAIGTSERPSFDLSALDDAQIGNGDNAEETADEVAAESAEEVAEESAEVVAEEVVEEAAEEVAEEAAEEVAEETAEVVADEAVEESAEEIADEAVEESAEEVANEAAEEAVEESAEKAPDEAADEETEIAADVIDIASEPSDKENAEDGESTSDNEAGDEADGFGLYVAAPKVSGSDNFPDISLREYLPVTEVESEAEEALTEVPSAEDDAEELEELEEPVQLEMDFGDEGETGEKDEPAAETVDEAYDPKKPRFIDTVFDTLELFVFCFAFVMIITSFFVRHSVVDGESMLNTLNDKDVVIISGFLYTPERGDVVVFEDKSVHPTPLIKRVIGVEGDVVEITKDKRIIVNGEVLEESYVYTDSGWRVHPGVWEVGEGEIFVLGDHRNESRDSEEFGPVKADSVLGRVLFRLYPFEDFGGIE